METTTSDEVMIMCPGCGGTGADYAHEVERFDQDGEDDELVFKGRLHPCATCHGTGALLLADVVEAALQRPEPALVFDCVCSACGHVNFTFEVGPVILGEIWCPACQRTIPHKRVTRTPTRQR